MIKKIFFSSVSILLSITLLAQPENCSNGIDDDGDGLIDCFDPDCYGFGDCNSSADGFFYGLPMDTCPAMSPPVNSNMGLIYNWTTPVGTDISGGGAGGNPPVIGDLDKDGIAEIIIGIAGDTLAVIDGKTGSIKKKIPRAYRKGTGGVGGSVGVLGDINTDGFGDIIWQQSDSTLMAYDYRNDSVIWITAPTTLTIGPELVITDLNGNGTPEIFGSQYIWNAQNGNLLGTFPFNSGINAPIACDLLSDSFCMDCAGLEIVYAPYVYSTDIVGASIIISKVDSCNLLEGGQSAVADLDGDGALDIATSNSDRLFTWNPRTRAVMNSFTFITLGFPVNGPRTCRPTIYRDALDKVNYVLGYAPKASIASIMEYLLNFDDSLGLKWLVPGLADQSAGRQNAIAFDLEGDGKKEIIMRPDPFHGGNFFVMPFPYLYVLDATTGLKRDSILCYNATFAVEGGVQVADIDGDGQVEIITTGARNAFGAGPWELMAIESCTQNWVCGRKVWNQYAYHPAFINDDLSVPRNQQNHAVIQEINEWGNQVPFKDVLGNYACELPDVVPTIQSYTYVGCDTVDVTVNVCNIGEVKVPELACIDKFISFYNGNPLTGGSLILTDTFHYNLEVDSCALKTVRIGKGTGPIDLYVFVNDSGTAPLSAPVINFTECKTQNNGDMMRIENVVPALITAPKDTLCLGDSVQMQASGGVSYLWTPNTDLDDDTLSNPTTTTLSTLKYTVTVTDSIGCTNDTNITIVIDSGILVTSVFASDTIICSGDIAVLSATGGINYVWTPGNSLDDSTKQNPIANPLNTTNYEVIINGLCSADTLNININVFQYPIADAGSDTAICLGSSMQLLGSGTGSYFWSPSLGLSDDTIANPIANPTVNTDYILSVDNNGCLDKDTVTIAVNPLAVISLSADSTICSSSSLQLQASGGNTYLWSPSTNLSATNISNPVFNSIGVDTNSYLVIATGNCGSDTGFVTITTESCNIFIPNAFSPNGDGGNDKFLVRGGGINNILIKVYDRWGNKVFVTKNINDSWDGTNKGKLLNAGVYVYYVTGSFNNGEAIDLKGNVSLVK